VTQIFRTGLLEGCADRAERPSPAGTARGLAALGARCRRWRPTRPTSPARQAAAEALGELDVLVVDVAATFAATERDRRARPAAGRARRRVGGLPRRGQRGVDRDPPAGKVVLARARPGAGAHAEAARAATENLARTLSIEWSRHGIRTTAITPGPATPDGEMTALAAYLASPAGDYFSGARLDLTR
jgi:hypothetical protein